MQRIILRILVLLALTTTTQAMEPREFDYFKPAERSQPLTLPGYYGLSKFGRGLYRIDSLEESRGQLNCIFLTFTAAAPEGTTPASKLAWKTARLEVEGRSVIRLSAVLVNPFERQAGAEGDVLTIRIDALTDAAAAKLRSVAEDLLRR